MAQQFKASTPKTSLIYHGFGQFLIRKKKIKNAENLNTCNIITQKYNFMWIVNS